MSQLNLKINSDEPKVSVHLRVRPEVRKCVEEIAEKENVKPSAIYRAILDFYFDKSATKCTPDGVKTLDSAGGDAGGK